MKVIFAVHDVYEQFNNDMEPLLENATNVQTNVHKELKKKYNKVLFLIQQYLDAKVLEKIANAEKSKEAWDNLLKSSVGDERSRKSSFGP